METVLFDPWTSDDAAAAAFVAHLHETRAEFAPPGEREPATYTLNTMRNRSSRHHERQWVRWSGREVVASAEATWWEAEDNRDRAWIAFDVVPDRFSDEVAAATLAPLLDELRGLGRTTLTVEVPQGHPFGKYVAARGATLGSVERYSVLPLRTLDPEELAALARPPEGYEIFTFQGGCPDDLLDVYTEMVRTMNTAPRDDLTYEDWVFTPERIRDYEAGLAARGHTAWTVCARRVGDTALAAYTNLVVAPEWPQVVEQDDTAVAVPHRGHGLGFAVKATNLLRLVTERPEAHWVTTWNAQSNSHMLRVNEGLGFRAQMLVEAYEMPIDALAGT